MTPQNEKLIEEASGAATRAHIQCCRGYALDNDKALRLIELTRSLISALAAATKERDAASARIMAQSSSSSLEDSQRMAAILLETYELVYVAEDHESGEWCVFYNYRRPAALSPATAKEAAAGSEVGK